MIQYILSKWHCFRHKQREDANYHSFLINNCDIKKIDEINNLPRSQNKLVRILGNGDSIKDLLANMNDECDYFVVSKHVVHPSYFIIKPKYYIIADPKWWTLEEGIDVTKRIFKETTWKMYLFVPRGANILVVPDNPFIKIIYINSSPYNGSKEHLMYLQDHNLSMPTLQNVIVGAIYTAIYLGYTKIELYGVEHSWTKALSVNDQNQVCILDTHFYDEEKVKAIPFTEYNKNKQSWRFYEVLNAFSRMFESYWELKEIAERKGVKILNCTPNSFIDAFERKVIDNNVQ